MDKLSTYLARALEASGVVRDGFATAWDLAVKVAKSRTMVRAVVGTVFILVASTMFIVGHRAGAGRTAVVREDLSIALANVSTLAAENAALQRQMAAMVCPQPLAPLPPKRVRRSQPKESAPAPSKAPFFSF